MRPAKPILLAAVLIAAATCRKPADRAATPSATPPAVAAAAPAGPKLHPTTHPGCYDPGDVLDVSVSGLSTDPLVLVTTRTTVAADGTIRPKLLGPVPVAYLDRADATRRIADAYRAANILANAQVQVRRVVVADGPLAAGPSGPIGNFDLVRCTFTVDGNDMATVGRVDDHGDVLPPLLPPVHVAGLAEPAATDALAKAYRAANIATAATASVVLLERAPADAAHVSLPDGPIYPVPPGLRDDYPDATPAAPVVATAVEPAPLVTAPILLTSAPSDHPAAFAPGDLLEVTVNGPATEPKLAMTFDARVQPDGTVALPIVGDVAVGGLDRPDATGKVVDAYRQANVLQTPVVAVRRAQVAGTGGPTPGPIGPFDLVRCSIAVLSSEPGLASTVVLRVSAGGNLDVPLIGPVHVAGLTDGKAAAKVVEAYRAANILQSGAVSVLTLERAPADAEHLALPDGPLHPVPESLRRLYAVP